jgi:hypothetical protein
MEDKGILIAGYDPQCMRNRFVTDLSNRKDFAQHMHLVCNTVIFSYICCMQWIHSMCVPYVLTDNPSTHLMCIPYAPTLDVYPTCTYIQSIDTHLMCFPYTYIQSIDTHLMRILYVLTYNPLIPLVSIPYVLIYKQCVRSMWILHILIYNACS